MSETPRTDALHAENARGTDFFSKHYEKLTPEEAVARAVIALKEQNPRNSPRKPS